MSGNGERWTWAAIVVAVAVPGVFASVAWLLRGADARQLADASGRSEHLRLQLLRAAAPPGDYPSAATKRWSLFEPADAAGIMQAIQNAADGAGVVLDHVGAGAAGDAGKQSLRVSGRGSPHALCTFLADVEQHERLMIVESGRFEPGPEATVGFELGVAAYHRGGGQ